MNAPNENNSTNKKKLERLVEVKPEALDLARNHTCFRISLRQKDRAGTAIQVNKMMRHIKPSKDDRDRARSAIKDEMYAQLNDQRLIDILQVKQNINSEEFPEVNLEEEIIRVLAQYFLEPKLVTPVKE